jgi:hypothetical protein
MPEWMSQEDQSPILAIMPKMVEFEGTRCQCYDRKLTVQEMKELPQIFLEMFK